MSREGETIYQARYVFNVEVKDKSDPSDPTDDALEICLNFKLESSERTGGNREANDIFDYVESNFTEEATLLYIILMTLEGLVETEFRPNVRRFHRRAVLTALGNSDEARRRKRLSSFPTKKRKLPNLVTVEETQAFIDEITEYMRDLSEKGIVLNKKNLGIKRHIERLRKSLENGDIKSARERKDAKDLVSSYDTNPNWGDVLENPWKSIGQDCKKYMITFKDLKAKLNQES